MKLQLDGQHLRLRIDEDELGVLLAGGTVEAATQLASALAIRCSLVLSSQPQAQCAGAPDHWQISLPGADVRELAGRLPTRDGLHFELAVAEGVTLALLFDIDVRDSARRLKASRAAQVPPRSR
jgi:hypothetical protein